MYMYVCTSRTGYRVNLIMGLAYSGTNGYPINGLYCMLKLEYVHLCILCRGKIYVLNMSPSVRLPKPILALPVAPAVLLFACRILMWLWGVVAGGRAGGRGRRRKFLILPHARFASLGSHCPLPIRCRVARLEYSMETESQLN